MRTLRAGAKPIYDWYWLVDGPTWIALIVASVLFERVDFIHESIHACRQCLVGPWGRHIDTGLFVQVIGIVRATGLQQPDEPGARRRPFPEDVFDFQRDAREDQCSIRKIESAICQRLGAFGRSKRYPHPVIVYTETVVCNDEDATLAAEARMERVMGIEPSYEAWEAAVLPLNYTRGSGIIL